MASGGGTELHSFRFDVYAFGVLNSEPHDVEEVGEGVEGNLGVLGVLEAVEVVHVLAPDKEEEHPREELEGVRHPNHTWPCGTTRSGRVACAGTWRCETGDGPATTGQPWGTGRPPPDVFQISGPQAFQCDEMLVSSVVSISPTWAAAYVSDHVEAVLEVV